MVVHHKELKTGLTCITREKNNAYDPTFYNGNIVCFDFFLHLAITDWWKNWWLEIKINTVVSEDFNLLMINSKRFKE
jgi:hypothetical protein